MTKNEKEMLRKIFLYNQPSEIIDYLAVLVAEDAHKKKFCGLGEFEFPDRAAVAVLRDVVVTLEGIER